MTLLKYRRHLHFTEGNIKKRLLFPHYVMAAEGEGVWGEMLAPHRNPASLPGAESQQVLGGAPCSGCKWGGNSAVEGLGGREQDAWVPFFAFPELPAEVAFLVGRVKPWFQAPLRVSEWAGKGSENDQGAAAPSQEGEAAAFRGCQGW